MPREILTDQDEPRRPDRSALAAPAPAPSPAGVLQLQQSAGNQAVVALMAQRGAASRQIQRVTYLEATQGLKPAHRDVLDKWLIHETAGDAGATTTADKILAPLTLQDLEARLELWLNPAQLDPTQGTKAQVGQQDPALWTGVTEKAKELAIQKLGKRLTAEKNRAEHPEKIFAKLIKDKHFELVGSAEEQLVLSIFDAARLHFTVTGEEITSYLRGRDKRDYTESMRETVTTILRAAVEQELLARIRAIVSGYFATESKALAPFVTDDGKLRNGDKAFIDPPKLTGYALNPDHPVGGNKAKLFVSVLGITAQHADYVRDELLRAAREQPVKAETGRTTQHGASLTVNFPIKGVEGKQGNVGMIESSWIYKTGEDFPRLITCFVVGGGKDWQPGVVYKAIFEDGTLVPEDDHPERIPEPTWDYVQSKPGPRVETRYTRKTNRLYQERHFDEKGHPIKDVDFTSPTLADGRPFVDHARPGHEHLWEPIDATDPSKGWRRLGGDG